MIHDSRVFRVSALLAGIGILLMGVASFSDSICGWYSIFLHQSIQNALNELNGGRRLLSEGQEDAAVPAADHLRDALEFLGQITGRVYTDELLDSVFSRFCVGK